MKSRLWRVVSIATLLLATVVHGQTQVGPRGGQRGAPPAGRGGRGAAPALGAVPRPAIPNAKPVRTCESLAAVALPDTTIESATIDAANPEVCRVTAITTHPPMEDRVRIWVAIPMSNWNGRFMGVGGGGFSGGSANGVNGPLVLGYASGSTDTGHEGGSGSFALDAGGRLNWQLIRDNAHLGIHEMTVTGKALTQALYGTPPRYSYFNGCSTGGRQGLMEAQRYPEDYNGIMSGAPGDQLVEIHSSGALGRHPHELRGESRSAVQAGRCDAGRDCFLRRNRPGHRRRHRRPSTVQLRSTDAHRRVGRRVRSVHTGRCGCDCETLGRPAASGRRLHVARAASRGGHGAMWGARGTPPQPQPFGIAMDWFRYFLAQNPNLDWTAITPAAYERYFDQSVEQYTDVIGTDNPDLTGFRDRGGKVIVWHGWSDQLISAHGTVDYYKRVQEKMGGAQRTSEFARLFMAPGVGHCGGGAGPAPAGQLDALLAWVEQGRAPETLQATRQVDGATRTRPLCPYPLVARYRGGGSTDDAANFECRAGF